MDKLLDMICNELEEIEKKGEMSAGDLDTVYKLIVAKEKLLRTDELEEKLGYSQHDGKWHADGTYGGSNSYGKRHLVRAHYSRDRYSMEDGKMQLADQIRDMIDDSSLTQTQKTALRKAVEALQE